MAKWIEVDPATLHVDKTETEDGVEIIVGLSPFDIPEAVRGYFDTTGDHFTIEFKYLDASEEKAIRFQKHDASLMVGKNSKCLQSISVKLPQAYAPVTLRVIADAEDALKHLAEDKKAEVGQRQLAAVFKALEKSKRELMKSH